MGFSLSCEFICMSFFDCNFHFFSLSFFNSFLLSFLNFLESFCLSCSCFCSNFICFSSCSLFSHQSIMLFFLLSKSSSDFRFNSFLLCYFSLCKELFSLFWSFCLSSCSGCSFCFSYGCDMSCFSFLSLFGFLLESSFLLLSSLFSICFVFSSECISLCFCSS